MSEEREAVRNGAEGEIYPYFQEETDVVNNFTRNSLRESQSSLISHYLYSSSNFIRDNPLPNPERENESDEQSATSKSSSNDSSTDSTCMRTAELISLENGQLETAAKCAQSTR